MFTSLFLAIMTIAAADGSSASRAGDKASGALYALIFVACAYFGTSINL